MPEARVSIEAICTGDLLEILRGESTPGAMGGVSRTLASVGSFVCNVQTADARDVRDYQARGQKLTHQAYCASDPQVTEADRLRWRKVAGTTVGDAGKLLRVLGVYPEGRPGAALLWVINLEQVTSREEG